MRIPKPKKASLNIFGKAAHNSMYLMAIGQLIVHWANNESLFMRILQAILGNATKEAHTIFHSHKNTMGRLDMVSAIGNGKISDPDLKAELSRLIGVFKGLTRTRNFFAHATYSYDDELNMVLASAVVFDNEQGTFRPEERRLELAALNEINDATTRAVSMNRELWLLSARIDVHFGRKPQLPPSLLPELQDELEKMKSPPTTPLPA